MMHDYIIYIYILIRYIIVLALIIFAVVNLFFVKKSGRRLFRASLSVICAVFIAGMFTAGKYRKTVIDIEDMCMSFDKLMSAGGSSDDGSVVTENENCRVFISEIITEQNPQNNDTVVFFNDILNGKTHTEPTAEGVNPNKAHKKSMRGAYNDVRYYATGMAAEMNGDTFWTYCGTYHGEIILNRGDEYFSVTYSIYTEQSDPRTIFYCYKPDVIILSDYL